MDNELRERFIKLETRFNERWDSHDARSEEKWDEINIDMKDVKLNLGILREEFKAQPLKCIKEMEGRIKRTIAGYVAIVVATVGFITLIVKLAGAR